MTDTSTHSFGVLLVEDDPVQRMNAVDALRAAGLQVIEATNADAAISVLARHHHLSIMVVDIELASAPMDGLMLAKVAAANSPGMAILVVSGVRMPSQDQLPTGARFLCKPYEVQELTSSVFSLVERRAQR